MEAKNIKKMTAENYQKIMESINFVASQVVTIVDTYERDEVLGLLNDVKTAFHDVPEEQEELGMIEAKKAENETIGDMWRRLGFNELADRYDKI